MLAADILSPDSRLRVEVVRQLEHFAAFYPDLSGLNRAARRPSPFHTPEYFGLHLANDEFACPEAEPLILLAFRGTRLVGILPLRRRPERVFGVARTRIEFLTTHDTDRPGIICALEDEYACAHLFLRHLLSDEHDWTFLQFLEQDHESALAQLADRAVGEWQKDFYVRRFPNNPNATVPLQNGFSAWFTSLHNFRSTLARKARSLVSAGNLEFICSADCFYSSAQLELYLALEERSWKHAAQAGISRHPLRVELFRALLGRGQAHTPTFHWLMLDGLPVAGMISLLFGDTAYQLELAFDQKFAEYSPGNVLFILGARDLIERGALRYNLLGNFSYHKSRWNAVVTDTHAVQVYRRGSLHYRKALAGEWLRRVRPPVTQLEADHNLTKPKVSIHTDGTDRAAARAQAAHTFANLAARSAIQRYAGSDLTVLFPFSVGA